MSARLDEALDHHRAGRLEEAARSYRLALATAAQNALVAGLLGDVLQALGRDAEAEAAYRDALRLDPKLAIVHMNLGLVLRRQRKLDQAVTALEEAVRCDPRLPEPRINLGLAYYESGRFEHAAAAYKDRKSTRLNSSHQIISYAVFCLKKKKKTAHHLTCRITIRAPPASLLTRTAA